ncbi:hypothetical protein DL96DRAFT_1820442 [Flagelloscypha sp. PMI_526]|nr:hypothetical protein DL96DRAFT_1820442 [Flagelloscypha sp. PMI_526]
MRTIPFSSKAITPFFLRYRERIFTTCEQLEQTQLFTIGVLFCLAGVQFEFKPNCASAVGVAVVEHGFTESRKYFLPSSDSPLSTGRFCQCLEVASHLSESPDPSAAKVIIKYMATSRDNNMAEYLPTNLRALLEKYQTIGRLARQLVAPVYRLPPEILVDILLYVVHSEGVNECIISFCDYWKAALLADPRLSSQIFALVKNVNDAENLRAVGRLPSVGLPLTIVLDYDPDLDRIPVDGLVMPLSTVITPIASRLNSLTISITPKWAGCWDLSLDIALGLMPELTFIQLRLFDDTDDDDSSASSQGPSVVPTTHWEGHWNLIRSLQAPKLMALYLCGPGSLAGIPHLIAPEKLLVFSIVSSCDESHSSCSVYLDVFTAALSGPNLKILVLDLGLGDTEPLLLSPSLSEIYLPHLMNLTLNVRNHANSRNAILKKLRTPGLSTFSLGVYFDEGLLSALNDFYDHSKFKIYMLSIQGFEDAWTAYELMIFLEVAGDELTTLTLDIPFSDDECIWNDLLDEDVLPWLRELTVTRSVEDDDDFLDETLIEMLDVRWWSDDDADIHWECERLKNLTICSARDYENVVDPENVAQWEKYRSEGMELDLQCPGADF